MSVSDGVMPVDAIVDYLCEREDKVFWVCRKCGHVHFGKKALNNCPVCDHPMAYFELKAENY